jgi:hypothetical protein
MHVVSSATKSSTEKFARAVSASKRARWDIDIDVIRGRTLDTSKKFLPDGLSLVQDVQFLREDERRFLGQIQGRTYANIFGLVERFINAKVLEIAKDYFFADQTALEGLIRFSDEELKHQELFRRIEALAGQEMPDGYVFVPTPNGVAGAVLQKSTWAVLALTLDIELFTQQHYLESIKPDENLAPLYKDVFLYHWKEEAQHAVMDEIELRRCDAMLDSAQRDRAVDDFIDLVVAVDGILREQAGSDVRYFAGVVDRLRPEERMAVSDHVLRAYRWQYIFSGAENPRFLEVLTSLVNSEQAGRIMRALATLR